MSAQAGQLLLYAPNVHTGGGFVLLQAILSSWPKEQPLVAWLDDRARDRLQPPLGSRVEWVKASVISRFAAEFSLAKTGLAQDRVLCFHGLPPLLRSKAPILVFQQNRIYLGQVSLSDYARRTRLRLRFEQGISRLLRHRALQSWYGTEAADIHVLPFAAPAEPVTGIEPACWDFVYVADGEAHKNHRNLIDAWVLLARQGLKPTLALTLSARDYGLKKWVEEQVRTYDLQVTDLGHLHHSRALKLYRQSRALVFPSKTESFGLPLIEARNAGLPILASELDFVRDVCEPVQSFDPNSPLSIARAVRRFLGQAELPVDPVGAESFLSEVLRDMI